MLILIKIKTIGCDRSNYKVYSPIYEPQELFVEIEITDEEVVKHSDLKDDHSVDYFVLTTQGYIELLGKLTDITDKVDKNHLKTFNK